MDLHNLKFENNNDAKDDALTAEELAVAKLLDQNISYDISIMSPSDVRAIINVALKKYDEDKKSQPESSKTIDSTWLEPSNSSEDLYRDIENIWHQPFASLGYDAPLEIPDHTKYALKRGRDFQVIPDINWTRYTGILIALPSKFLNKYTAIIGLGIAAAMYVVAPFSTNNDAGLSSEKQTETQSSETKAERTARLQLQVNSDVEAYMKDCFSSNTEAECRQSRDLDSLNRSIPFVHNRPTVVYIDFGHGLGEPGASYIQLKGDPSYYAPVFAELADRMISKGYAPNKAKAIKALEATKQEMTENIGAEDGYYNLVYTSQELYENLGKPETAKGSSLKYKIENLLLDFMREKKLALSEQDIVATLGNATVKKLQDQGYLVATSHAGPTDLFKSDDEYRAQKDHLMARSLGVRAGLSRALSEKYNIVTISLHADSSSSAKVEHSAFYIQDKGESVPALVASELQQAWTQGGSHVKATNLIKKHDYNLAMAGKVINGGLLETFQLGNYAGRTRAYNMMVDKEGAQDKVVGSLVTAITSATDKLKGRAFNDALMAAPLSLAFAQSQALPTSTCRQALGEVQPQSFLRYGA